jgi:hypothetical protein
LIAERAIGWLSGLPEKVAEHGRIYSVDRAPLLDAADTSRASLDAKKEAMNPNSYRSETG